MMRSARHHHDDEVKAGDDKEALPTPAHPAAHVTSQNRRVNSAQPTTGNRQIESRSIDLGGEGLCDPRTLGPPAAIARNTAKHELPDFGQITQPDAWSPRPRWPCAVVGADAELKSSAMAGAATTPLCR